MLLSIIIPMYNCEKYINECLDSIINKINSNIIEIILVNDGSTDNTESICQRYHNKNIRYLKNENHGVSYSRNFGIKISQGKYIMFVDADDKLEENWINILEYIEESKDDIIYFSKNFENQVISDLEIIKGIVGYPSQYHLGNLSSVCSKIYKRTFILANNIFFHEDIINGEDLLFNLAAILKTDKIKLYSLSIYKYRINLTSATHSYDEKLFYSNFKFLEIMNNYFENHSKISRREGEKYLDFSLFNSIYIFLYRISLIKNKKIQKKKIMIFDKSIYKDYLKKYKIQKEYGYIKNIFIYILKFHLYDLALFLMKLKNIRKQKISNMKEWEEI